MMTARTPRTPRTAPLLSLLGAVVGAIVVAACSSGGNGARPAGSSGTPDSGSSGSSGSSGADASADASTTGLPSTCNGDDGPPPPSSPDALQTWLGAGAYKCWAHESSQHPSDGPHGGEVKVFLNTKLDTSMKGTTEHPEGAVAVKEFFAVGGKEITGWAVLIKTQAASANGGGYYWYEVFGTQAGASNYEGQGKALCVNCHSAGGKDFVLIHYPLR